MAKKRCKCGAFMGYAHPSQTWICNRCGRSYNPKKRKWSTKASFLRY